MALVVPNTCRFTIHGSVSGLDPVINIVDMLLDTDAAGVSRADACDAAAGQIIKSWWQKVIPIVGDLYDFEKVSWVDLDSADGSTGEKSDIAEVTLPVSGGRVTEPVPYNAAVLVRKTTTSARGQRNGRMYVGIVPGDDVENSSLSATAQPVWQTALSEFRSDINDEPLFPSNFDRYMVVVHTTGPNPTTGTTTPVSGLAVQTRLATQRRRLR